MGATGSKSYVSRLEQGKIPKVAFTTVIRYLQACKAPIGKFMLELAQSGAFGEAEAESVRGFTAQKLRGGTSNEQARREKARARDEKREMGFGSSTGYGSLPCGKRRVFEVSPLRS
jgi:hypothetical protein